MANLYGLPLDKNHATALTIHSPKGAQYYKFWTTLHRHLSQPQRPGCRYTVKRSATELGTGEPALASGWPSSRI